LDEYFVKNQKDDKNTFANCSKSSEGNFNNSTLDNNNTHSREMIYNNNCKVTVNYIYNPNIIYRGVSFPDKSTLSNVNSTKNFSSSIVKNNQKNEEKVGKVEKIEEQMFNDFVASHKERYDDNNDSTLSDHTDCNPSIMMRVSQQGKDSSTNLKNEFKLPKISTSNSIVSIFSDDIHRENEYSFEPYRHLNKYGSEVSINLDEMLLHSRDDDNLLNMNINDFWDMEYDDHLIGHAFDQNSHFNEKILRHDCEKKNAFQVEKHSSNSNDALKR